MSFIVNRIHSSHFLLPLIVIQIYSSIVNLFVVHALAVKYVACTAGHFLHCCLGRWSVSRGLSQTVPGTPWFDSFLHILWEALGCLPRLGIRHFKFCPELPIPGSVEPRALLLDYWSALLNKKPISGYLYSFGIVLQYTLHIHNPSFER